VFFVRVTANLNRNSQHQGTAQKRQAPKSTIPIRSPCSPVKHTAPCSQVPTSLRQSQLNSWFRSFVDRMKSRTSVESDREVQNLATKSSWPGTLLKSPAPPKGGLRLRVSRPEAASKPSTRPPRPSVPTKTSVVGKQWTLYM